MKPTEFKVDNMGQFQDMVTSKDINISKAIVNAIIGNLKTRKKFIHMLSIKCMDENTTFDITLERSHFADTLKENLKYFEEGEWYEECSKINKAIGVLNKPKT
jgi:hypothetical protein